MCILSADLLLMDFEHKEQQFSFVIDIVNAKVWHGKIFLEVHSDILHNILSLDTVLFRLSFMLVSSHFQNFPICV